MDQNKIDAMSDEELYRLAVSTYRELSDPSENLRLLYDAWLSEDRLAKHKVRRVHSETVYKLSLFEKGMTK